MSNDPREPEAREPEAREPETPKPGSFDRWCNTTVGIVVVVIVAIVLRLLTASLSSGAHG